MMKRETTPPSRMLTVKDVDEHCQVSERTVWRWIRDHELKVHRLGRRTRISEEDFEEFLRRNRG